MGSVYISRTNGLTLSPREWVCYRSKSSLFLPSLALFLVIGCISPCYWYSKKTFTTMQPLSLRLQVSRTVSQKISVQCKLSVCGFLLQAQNGVRHGSSVLGHQLFSLDATSVHHMDFASMAFFPPICWELRLVQGWCWAQKTPWKCSLHMCFL
jgi:hypothetical protein